LVLKRLDVGLVYAVWSGVGTALIASIGIVWFKEPLTAVKIGSFALIILGVVGLNLSGARWKASGSADLSRFDTRLVSHT
jgi:small multidrug resistance pump